MQNAAAHAGSIFFKPNVVNAFSDSVEHILKMTTLYQVKMGQPTIENGFMAKGDVAGCIQMTTESAIISCKLTISFQKETAFFMLNKMLGVKTNVVSEEVHDLVGEITNMIYGSARQVINRYGFGLKMSLPTVAKSKEEIEKLHGELALVIPFSIKGELPFWVELSIERNKKNTSAAN